MGVHLRTTMTTDIQRTAATIPAYMERGSFYGFDVALSIASAGGSDSETVLIATEFDFLVRHIDVALYDADGAIIETSTSRDEVTINVVDGPTGYNWFSAAIDAFSLRRLTQSEKWVPIVIRAQTQFEVTATHVSHGDNNTAPITVHLTLIGQKVPRNVIPERNQWK